MMSATALFKVVRPAVCASRNFGVFAPALNKASDPIQKLFLEKIQEYKSKSSGGKLVDSTPEIERELKNELERVAKQYDGGAGVDMTQFPTFKFEDPQIDSITTTN
ncbi:ATP synthase-coupling factor 6, mitochondrial-like [Episyrphus balteatus]|uniref:ATP synthase-coupling factor 6, mitochondrial-like n=1 Tax=Episyrphus balteatus TaxID=286459 RepID=UPI002485350D|nr:ATP synthase-coupling factor 6, mitochondrial-like [Episyrphus balteatus]